MTGKRELKSGYKSRCSIWLLLAIFAILLTAQCGCMRQEGEGTPADVTADATSAQELRTLTLLFFSDTQADPETGDYTSLGEMAAQAAASAGEATLVIFGGDSVNDGSDEEEWRRFAEAAQPLISGRTTLTAAGNHDDYPLLVEQFEYPAQAPPDHDKGYSYTYYSEPVFFIILDSNIMGAGKQEDVLWLWLRAELQSETAQKAAWRIVVMHHPMWTVADNPKDEARAVTMRETFLPELQEHGADLILCGHQHSYARTLPMDRETASADGNGIVQIMAASGAKATYKAGERDYIAASHETKNYLLLTANESELAVIAYDSSGVEIDSLTLRQTAKPLNGATDTPEPLQTTTAEDPDLPRIRVLDTAGNELWSFSEETLKNLPAERRGEFSQAYSTVNNWPTARFYAADGYKVESILAEAGVLETAQTITFRAADGYETSLTREQLLSRQNYYPNQTENDEGAQPVYPVIAYRWREGTNDISEARDDKPTLIIGQRDRFEQTNPVFVVGVAEMIVDFDPCESWPIAGGFPLPGPIAHGETVKLQHPNIGKVKLYYTLDGSTPTTESPMYNPSAYQPELTKPIPITEPVVIKVLAVGYGKSDSEIAVLEYYN